MFNGVPVECLQESVGGAKTRHPVSPAVREVLPQQQIQLRSYGHGGRYTTTRPC